MKHCTIVDCGYEDYFCKGLCKRHYYQMYFFGKTSFNPRKPNRPKLGNYRNETIEQRFWRHVKLGGEDECWVWIGSSTNASGHKNFQFGGTNHLAHRFSYELHKGEIPKGLLVCHSCDNPLCVNPKHLWVGTHKDNMQDMVKKGRQNKKRKTTISSVAL